MGAIGPRTGPAREMTALEAVRRRLAIDTIFAHQTHITWNDRTIVLRGAAHRTWIAARRRTWFLPL